MFTWLNDVANGLGKACPGVVLFAPVRFGQRARYAGARFGVVGFGSDWLKGMDWYGMVMSGLVGSGRVRQG